MIRLTFLVSFILILTSCNSQPDTLEIKKCIKKHYDRISIQDGSGVYEIENIQVGSIENDKTKKHWIVESIINGTYSNPSLPNREELNKPFSDKKSFVFKKTGEIWQCEPKLEE